jgi:hypothetical protein
MSDTEHFEGVDGPKFPLNGGCACGTVRYQLRQAPLYVHCCHCLDCQRENGSAFALNAMIESSEIISIPSTSPNTKGEIKAPVPVNTPTDSGFGQVFLRCPVCHTAVWSYYGALGPALFFVKTGTLDSPGLIPPDIHLFTRSKQSWITLSDGKPAMEEYYDRKLYWPQESLDRLAAITPELTAWSTSRKKMQKYGTT